MADNAYKGLTVKIGANTNDAAKALKDINDKAKGVAGDLRKLNNALKLDPGNTDLLTEKQRLLEKQIQKTKERLEVFQEIQAKGRNQKGMDDDTWARLRSEITESKINLENFQKQAKECKEALKSISDPFKKLERDAAEAEKAFEKTADELKVLSDALKVDPKNTELLTRQQEVLGRQIENTTQKLEKYREIEAKGKDHEGMDEAKWTQLKSSIALAEKELEELAEQSRKCDNAIRGIGENDDDFDEIAREIAKMDDAIEDANQDLDKMDDKMDGISKSSKLDNVGSGFERLGDTIEDGSRRVADFGDAYTRTVSAGIAAGAVASVKAAVDIDTAMTSVRKTVEGTGEQYDALKQAAIDFSQTNAVSADQILELDALGAQLGFTLDELQKFGEVASGLDIATNMDAETAATEMAHFANIMGMAHEDIDRYASTIVGLGNTTATTESDISHMAQRIAGAGKSIGLSSADVLGMAAALSSLGIEAEAGGTAISTIMSNIDSASAMATEGIKGYADELGMSTDTFLALLNQSDAAMEEYAQQTGIKTSDAKKHWKQFFTEFAAEHGQTFDKFKKGVNDASLDLQNWAEAAGMSAAEFAQAWKDKPIETFQQVMKGLQNGVEEGSNLSVMLEQLGIDTIRQTDLMKRVANSGDLMTDTIAKANTEWEKNTALSDEVANRNDSMAAKFEILKNRVTAVAIEVGEPLASALMDAIDAAEPFFKAIERGAEAFDHMDKGQQQAILSAAAHIAAIGPLLSIVGRLGVGVGGAAQQFGILLKAMKNGVEATEGASAAISGLKGGLVGIGIAAAAVAASFAIKAWMEWQQLIKDTEQAHKSLADMEDEVALKIGETNDSVLSAEQIISDYAGGIHGMSDEVRDLLSDSANSASEFIDKMTEVGTNSGMLNNYVGIIEDLGKKSSLTKDEQVKLKQAVEKYNEITGDSLEIIDAQTGKLSKSTGEIKANTRAWEINAKMQAYNKLAAESMEQYARAEYKLADAQKQQEAAAKKLAEAQQEYTDHLGQSPEIMQMYLDKLQKAQADYDEATWSVNTLNNEMKDSEQRYEDCNKKIADLQTTLDNQNSTLESVRTAFDQTSDEVKQRVGEMFDSVDDFALKLYDAGLKSEDMRFMTDQSFRDMLDACGTNVNEMIGWIHRYNEQQIEEKIAQIDSTPLRNAINAARELHDIMQQKFQATISAIFPNMSEHANGGMFPQHADGGVFTQATLTPDGIVGEAGAEWYGQIAGNMRAAIPLTSAHAKPFTDQIADGVSERLGQRGGDTYLVINGAKVNADEEIEDKFYDLMMALKRKAGMYSGS